MHNPNNNYVHEQHLATLSHLPKQLGSMLLYLLLLSVSTTEAKLTCSRSNSCPGSITTCVCANAPALLQWTVTPPGEPDCTIRYGRNSQEGVVTTLCEGHIVVLDAVGTNQFSDLIFNSSLTVTQEENVTVTWASGVGLESTTLRVASKRAESGTHYRSACSSCN